MKKLNIGLLALLFIALITVGATTGISGPKTIWGKISDTVARAIRIDSATHVIETIEHEHSKIHSGSSYVCTDVQHVDATTQKWMVLTPDSTEYAHMLFSAACTGEMQMDVTEHSDSTGTTVLFIANRRRIIPTTSASVVVFRGVTGGSTDGTITLFSKRVGATDATVEFISSFGNSRGANEFILNPNTKYVVKVTTYRDVYVTLDLNWYEHINKD